MAVKQTYPTLKPTADFNFAATKRLDRRITFSRASTAYYYDGSVEKVEENLRTGSTTVPSQVETTKLDNAALTPDLNQACLLTPNTVNGWHTGGYQSVYANAGLDYVFSFVAKANGYTKVRVGNTTISTVSATFDLTAVTVSSTGGSAYLASGISDIGGGWRRCWIKANHAIAQIVAWAVTPFPDSTTGDTYGRANFAGDGVSGAYFGEFQVEQRSSLGPHVPTTTRPISNFISKLVMAAAGEPRFAHDPLTRESLGLLFEEQRTNLLTYSSDFAHASWVKTNCSVIPAAGFAPDGTMTATKVVAGTTNGIHFLYKAYGSTSGTYAASIYAKAAGLTRFYLYLNDGATGSAYAIVDLVAKTCTTTKDGAWTNNVVSLTEVENGWFRVSVSATQGGGSSTLIALWLRDNLGGGNFAGDGVSGLLIWQAQLEAGAFPTSPIPTVASRVTRAAEAASITGANLASIFNPGEGTLLAEGYVTNGAAVVKCFAALTDGSNNNRMILHVSTLTPGGMVSTGSVAQVSQIGSLLTLGSAIKFALAYSANNFGISFNGAATQIDSDGSIPIVDRLEIGSYVGAGWANAPVRRVALYPTRLPDAVVQGVARI